MLVNIQLEIKPEEVPLATELLATLRLITQHVGKGAASAAPVVKNVGQLLQGLLAQASDESKLDQVAASISAMLSDPAYGSSDTIGEELLEVYDATVLNNTELVTKGGSVVPYIKLLPRLAEPIKAKVRDKLISKVLSHLTKKRPVGADRTQFFAHAEAFAVLVNIEFVSIDGAAQTMEKLMNKPDTRTAAVTMLGKTVEYCQAQLLTKCKPENLTKLLKALENVTEEVFAYDKNWVLTTLYQTGAPGQMPAAPAASVAPAMPMPMPTPAAAGPPAGAPARRPTALTAAGSYDGHTDMVFTITYDSARQMLVSSSKDNTVRVWNNQGQADSRFDMPSYYICSMDVHPKHNLLMMCGVASDPTKGPMPPCIVAHDAQQRYRPKGTLSLTDRKVATCVRCLGPGSDAFVTGETKAGNPADVELVCHYDLTRSSNFDSLQPVHEYLESEELCTCIVPLPANPHTFVAGSRNGSMLVYDCRVDRSVGQFGQPDPTTFKALAHNQMVTWMDVSDTILVSGCLDTTIGFWDLRSLGTTPGNPVGALNRMNPDGQPVLKVVTTGAPVNGLMAVSTLAGLYMVDFANVMAPITTVAAVDLTRPFKAYHDVKWATGTGYLFAASENTRIDLLVAQ